MSSTRSATATETDVLRCETCGGERLNPMRVTLDGVTHVFDTFDCLIERLAPSCRTCGRRVTGHSIRSHGAVYCCRHCEQVGPAPLAYGQT